MKKPLHINFILPFPVTKPVGGAKVMYEYANRLSEAGHIVTIYHSIRRPFKKSSMPVWIKQLVFLLRGVQRPKWFPLDRRVRSVIVNEIIDSKIEDADIIMSTWWQMAYAIDMLSEEKGKKFNLIQDYEIWTGQEQLVFNSYKLNLNHIVIAGYLKELVEGVSNQKAYHIPIAIDSSIFFQECLPITRDPSTVIMMYSKEERKGSEFGIKALEVLNKEMPELKVILFSVYPRPENIPDNWEYHQRPDNLRELFNKSAVFITPSLREGWGLPNIEAMACGCALICTCIDGHLDYAINGETAILVQPGDWEDLYCQLKRLMNNNELRVKLSEAGRRCITSNFSWQLSLEKLEQLYYSKMQL